MAQIDKIKVQKVIKEKFHDHGRDATIEELNMEYINEYPDYYLEHTMEEQIEEMFLDGAIALKKIKQIIDNNEDVQLGQDEQ